MNNKFNSDGYYTAHSPEDIPKDKHLAIIEFGSIYIEGDERSRTAPGHGYPARTESTTEYRVFRDAFYFKSYIEKLVNPTYGSPKKNWVAVNASSVSVEMKVVTNVSI